MLYDKRWDEAPAEIKQDEWRNVLLKAADLVEKGWIIGSYQSGDNYCAVGALAKAATGTAYGGWDTVGVGAYNLKIKDEQMAVAHDMLLKEINRWRIFNKYASVPKWNDFKAKSGATVAAYMRKAATRAV